MVISPFAAGFLARAREPKEGDLTMLLIDNDAVRTVLTMTSCIDAQDASFRRLASNKAIHRARIDMYVPTGRADDYYRWGSMAGADAELGCAAIRLKSDLVSWPRHEGGTWTEEKCCIEPGNFCGLILLFSTTTGEPLAIINDGVLQHMRVAGGAGLGIRYLAREDASSVGIFGSGGMARDYLDAAVAVRRITTAKVYSPTREHREKFAAEASERHGLTVEAVDAPEKAVEGVDILMACTDSMSPVVHPEHLARGMHVTNLGPYDLAPEVLTQADLVVRQGDWGASLTGDNIYRGRGHSPVAIVAGSDEEIARIPAAGKSVMLQDTPRSFLDVAAGRAARETTDDITVYINVGFQGLQFASVGAVVLEEARKKGLGRELPTEWFMQDIRD